MQSALQILFWLCTALVGYAYVAYPLLLAIAARLRPRPVHKGNFTGSVAIILCAHNEENRIAARRDELLALLLNSGNSGELIIVSDGSTDRTATAAAAPGKPIRVIELTENLGKAEALSRAAAASAADILVFADARQRWANDAISRLIENFADPAIGGVSGDLCLESAGSNRGVGVYWRYEKNIRKLESRVHSCVGATGHFRRPPLALFCPIPPPNHSRRRLLAAERRAAGIPRGPRSLCRRHRPPSGKIPR